MKILTVLMFLGAASLISSQEDYFAPEPFVDESQVLDLAEEVEVEEEEILGTPVQRLAYSVSEFGYDLYRLMAIKDPSANVFLSPLSVAASLSALSLGATSTNKDILQRILNYNSLQDLDVHSAFKDLLTEITMQPKQFKTVSRIYAKKRLKIQQAFVNQVSQYYGSRPKLVTNVQRELSNMNQWLKIQTGGKISQAVRSLPASLSLLLLSAAHYQGKLVTKFNAANTRESSFRLEYGQEVNVPTMSSQHYPLRYGYDSELNCKIGLFRYMGDISLLIFLPSGLGQNMSAIEESLTPVFVHDLVHQLHLAKASVSIPKLKFETKLELKEVLGQMNLKPLYSATELGKLSNNPAYISSVTHVASLTLAEGGQEEAASPLPSSPQVSLQFHVNRPFLMLLYDNPSGSLLHIARVMDPRTLVTSLSPGQGRQ